MNNSIRTMAALLLAGFVQAGLHGDAWAQDELPIRRVVLFNVGIGYFEHHAEVEGNATVPMPLSDENLDDFLKTLVMQDANGGSFWIDYDAGTNRDTDHGFALDAEPTLAELLQQLRGERVTSKNPEVEGVIFGLELKDTVTAKGDVVAEEFITLVTADGLTSLPLKSFGSIQLTKKELQEKLNKALLAMAEGRATLDREVRLRFKGEGKRRVQVGYLQQTPVWKTTHRLVLGEKPQLQSWAILENTGASDWENVKVTLVGGSPISFQMALSDPRFVRRPHAALPFSGIPMPRIHQGASQLAGMGSLKQRPFVTSIVPYEGMGGGMGGGGFGGGGGGMGGMGMPSGGGDPFGGANFGADGKIEPFPSNLSLVIKQSQSNASSGSIGQFFQYEMKGPVELSAGRSAMVPIMAADIDAQSMSLYTPSADQKRLLHTVFVTNNTDAHLAAGPIAIYEDGIYAGESQITHCPPGEHRLASYAADLTLEAETATINHPSKEISLRIENGLLVSKVENTREFRYRFVALDNEAKTVLLEHQRPQEPWEAIDDKQLDELRIETTETHSRYKVPVAAKEPTIVILRETHVAESKIQYAHQGVPALSVHLKKSYVSQQDKEILAAVIELWNQVAKHEKQLEGLKLSVNEIERDQKRIRDNMDKLDQNSELYKQYVKQLTEQEAEFARLRTKIGELTKARQALIDRLPEHTPPTNAPGNDPFG